MNDRLSADEYEALEQISRLAKGERPSACVARNTKRLIGQKFAAHRKDGLLQLSDKGREALLIKHCIDALRALQHDPMALLKPEIGAFLSRKNHIAPRAEGGFDVTEKGRESLADIEAGQP